MATTYDEQQKRLQDAGLWEQTSPYDRTLMQFNPNFGNDIYNNKTAYNAATDDQGRANANANMNTARARYGAYTGGVNGMEYNPSGNTAQYADPLASYYGGSTTTTTTTKTSTPQGGQLTARPGYVSPTYNSPYIQQILGANSAIGKPAPAFSYNYQSDPTYQALLKSYQQNAQIAGQNTLARAAAATGGMPSTYAVQAATAAQNQELNQLANMIPQLQQQAYSRYADQRDYNQQARIAALNNLRGLEQENYGMFRDTVGDRYNEEDRDYAREWNANLENYNRAWKEDERTYSRAEDTYKRALAAAQARAQYTGDYSALEDFYGLPKGSIAAYMAQQQAAKGGGGGRGGRGGRGGGGGGNKTDSGKTEQQIGATKANLQRAYDSMGADQFDAWVKGKLASGEVSAEEFYRWNNSKTNERLEERKKGEAYARQYMDDYNAIHGK